MSKIDHRPLVDMQAKDIVGSYKEATLAHHHGASRKIFYTEVETPMPENKKIISLTDPEGYISNANSAFVDMSGYSRDELLGMPHCILRHPDMPKAAFATLWQDIQATGSWQGFVKNLRKDGGFYWVHATISAMYRSGELVGFTSTRVAPSRKEIDKISWEYEHMKMSE